MIIITIILQAMTYRVSNLTSGRVPTIRLVKNSTANQNDEQSHGILATPSSYTYQQS